MMTIDPLRRFLLTALLWLPAAFFLWFWLAGVLVWPIAALSRIIILHSWPQLFSDLEQHGFLIDVTTRVLVHQASTGGQMKLGELVLSINPMAYGYSLPLFAGLVMATPAVSAIKPGLQLLIGSVLIVSAQVLGVAAEALKLLAFDAGTEGATVIDRAGLSADAIALAYQFGYLILPAVVPAALWILLNRRFIEMLTNRSRVEP